MTDPVTPLKSARAGLALALVRLLYGFLPVFTAVPFFPGAADLLLFAAVAWALARRDAARRWTHAALGAAPSVLLSFIVAFTLDPDRRAWTSYGGWVRSIALIPVGAAAGAWLAGRRARLTPPDSAPSGLTSRRFPAWPWRRARAVG